MQHVEVRVHLPAPQSTVFAALLDAPGWTRWAGLGRIEFELEGDANRVGAVRVFRLAGTRERILSVEPGARFTYSVISGVPIRDHLGETVVESASGGGSVVTWRCRFESSIPGAGALQRWIVAYVYRRTLERLARHLTGRSTRSRNQA